jgi:hypothetical protein
VLCSVALCCVVLCCVLLSLSLFLSLCVSLCVSINFVSVFHFVLVLVYLSNGVVLDLGIGLRLCRVNCCVLCLVFLSL